MIGQPFDLVKVRIQAGQFTSPVEAFAKTLAKEGPFAFYKGTAAPLVGVGLCVSVQFYAFHEAKRYFLKQNKGGDLNYSQFYLAGAFAGAANTVITSPVEQIRILLQTQPSGEKKIYQGPIDAVKKIYGEQGLVKGLYRGFGVTLLREAQAYGVWFLTYEYLMHQAIERRQQGRETIPTWQLMLYGALAGEALWLSSYPLDVIKSKLQSDGFGAHSRYNGSALKALGETWSKQGARGLWRGIVPTLLRAMPASAGTFATVELTLRLLG